MKQSVVSASLVLLFLAAPLCSCLSLWFPPEKQIVCLYMTLDWGTRLPPLPQVKEWTLVDLQQVSLLKQREQGKVSCLCASGGVGVMLYPSDRQKRWGGFVPA